MVLKKYFELTKGNVDIKVRSISLGKSEFRAGMTSRTSRHARWTRLLFSLALLAHNGTPHDSWRVRPRRQHPHKMTSVQVANKRRHARLLLRVDGGGSRAGLPARGLCRFLQLSDVIFRLQKSDFRGVTEGTARVQRRTWRYVQKKVRTR